MSTEGAAREWREQLQATLGGAYTLERELGGGGMSRVFVAEDARLDRRVVVKVLHPDLAAGVSAQRFEREIRLAARLQHPHVVPVLSAGEVGGLPYYTMPYVDGESLRQRLAREGALPLTDAVRLLRELADALAYAHAEGIVHRDLKPENVLLSRGHAAVADFGVAKALAFATQGDGSGRPPSVPTLTATAAGSAVGTPAYMAPEQAAGDPHVDHRADLYAWGVVAYEVLAGRHPFAERATPQAILAAHLAETPVPLAERGAEVPPGLAALVMRCLAKDPAVRPASAAEILVALDGAVLEHATHAGRPRRLARLVAAGVALALVVGAVATWSIGGAREGAAVAALPEPLMVAVLPFEHDGPAERAYFANGLTDAVTGRLGALAELAVIDRGSAVQYRGTAKPTRQIGRELGVPYLVQGVVRWAQDASGSWRAQVTTTLVDARTGTTRWTGEPVVVTPADPFTAQAQIATDVARTLAVQLRPADRAGLAQRPTENAAAYDAYLRGRAYIDAAEASSASSLDAERAVAELERAVALDSTFAAAWRWLGLAYVRRGVRRGTAEASWLPQAQRAWRRAAALAPDSPAGLLARVSERQSLGDTAAAVAAAARAYAVAPNDPEVIRRYAIVLHSSRDSLDRRRALLARAVRLDPRSMRALNLAADAAAGARQWDEAARYADAMITLDSTDERAWTTRLELAVQQGDTVAAQRTLARALARLGPPSRWLLLWMPKVGGDFGQRLVALSASEAGVVRWSDSAYVYYPGKGDVFLRRGDVARARVYYDSARRVLRPRLRGIRPEQELRARLTLATADAILGDTAEARRELARALVALELGTPGMNSSGTKYPAMVAAVYAWLAEPDSAVLWLEREVATSNYDRSTTARELALWPTLRPLWRTPAFTRFLRAHAE